MSRGETTQNTKRRRISKKYAKEYDVHYRYDDFHQKIMNRYRIKNDLDVGTKNTVLIDEILRDWFKKEVIEEFGEEDPDLMIKLKKQKDKTKWIDYIFDHDDMREIEALENACHDIRQLKANHKY